MIVNTFIGKSTREFTEVGVSIQFSGESDSVPVSIIIDERFNLEFEIDGLLETLSNLKRSYHLADEDYYNQTSEVVVLEGIIGVDAIQFMTNISSINCMNGTAFLSDNTILPYGNVDNFLTKQQLARKYESKVYIDKDSDVSFSVVNFVLNPEKSYFDPINSVANDSEVDGI